MHGLPLNTKTPLTSWPELLGYLDALSRCGKPVSVGVGENQHQFVLMCRGELSQGGPSRDPASPRRGQSFHVGPSNRRDLGGSFTLFEDLYEGGCLLTYDGDDYFFIAIEMSGTRLFLEDTNSI